MPGVTRASVNLATERATVDAAAGVSASQLADAVKQAGYGATPVAAAAPCSRARRPARSRARCPAACSPRSRRPPRSAWS
ncbi:heavy-metal-associated domain-containing protein [Burkholderia seminalis]|uniref:heavy-metal-associated domain-containing protein n=1 Tax=Burkholderia seminalis TaxID=488731 RepID=UPI00385034D0